MIHKVKLGTEKYLIDDSLLISEQNEKTKSILINNLSERQVSFNKHIAYLFKTGAVKVSELSESDIQLIEDSKKYEKEQEDLKQDFLNSINEIE